MENIENEESIKNEKRYYVYILLDSTKPGEYIYEDIKLDYEPFYVGKGTRERIKRTLLHRECSFKVNKIKKIRNNGGEVIAIKLYDKLEDLESRKLEIETIRKIGRRDLKLGPLSNLTDGGEGRLSSSPTEETRLKISKTKKEYYKNNPAKPLSVEAKQHLREINTGDKNPFYGKTHTKEVREAHSDRVTGMNHPMYNKKHSKETIELIKQRRAESVDQEKFNVESRIRNSKAVIQYDLSGNYINEFESIKVAAKTLGLTESMVGKSCRGEVKKPTKFIFLFKETTTDEMYNSYLYKIGDIIVISNKNYILYKRNKKSFILEYKGDFITLKRDDYDFIWNKRLVSEDPEITKSKYEMFI